MIHSDKFWIKPVMLEYDIPGAILACGPCGAELVTIESDGEANLAAWISHAEAHWNQKHQEVTQ